MANLPTPFQQVLGFENLFEGLSLGPKATIDAALCAISALESPRFMKRGGGGTT